MSDVWISVLKEGSLSGQQVDHLEQWPGQLLSNIGRDLGLLSLRT